MVAVGTKQGHVVICGRVPVSDAVVEGCRRVSLSKVTDVKEGKVIMDLATHSHPVCAIR